MMRFKAKNWPAWALREWRRKAEPEVFGPPTEFEHKMAEMFKASAAHFLKLNDAYSENLKFLTDSVWPEGAVVRVRLPEDYAINRIA